MKNKRFISLREALLFLAAWGYNLIIFIGTKPIARNFPHHQIGTKLDEAIPLVPWTILIYLGCYLFWIWGYYFCIQYDKTSSHRFLISHFIGETVALLCFLFFPTVMTRPEITGTTLFHQLLRMTYRIDAPNTLLPSLHCVVSWLCWIGVRGHPRVPKWGQWLCFVCAAAICISTLTVKQHVIADVISGVLLAEGSFCLSGFCVKILRKRIKTEV